jgi:lyso-ornithine lipid O-acyltransferase
MSGKLNYGRGALRFCILLASLAEVGARFAALTLRSRGRMTADERAMWLYESCARIRRRLAIPLHVEGPVPAGGLIVSNHLSYLDVLLFGAVMPCGFVAKREVRGWPVFGALARAAGTMFVHRERGAQSEEAAAQMEERIRAGVPVLLFAEGSSSDGSVVLPFRSSLFEAAVRAGAAVTPAMIRYYADDAAEAEISYWGKMVFLLHLLRTLCLHGLRASICFGKARQFGDRKEAAREMWQEVSGMRQRCDAEILAAESPSGREAVLAC